MPDLRYLSGIQPSGRLHLGNYFGAIRAHIAHQKNAYYFIADYHALTTVQNAQQLRESVFDVALTYLALGLDPEQAVLFRQSDVPEVTELTWLLMTTTGMGLLERAHSYKDKVAHGFSPSMGLFSYPVLMAADILAYEADIVPVGKDQVQHLEMARDMAQSFNAIYGPKVDLKEGEAPPPSIFKLPNYVLGTPEPVLGLDGEKMSKSYNNTIPIFERGKALRKLVLSIKTDSTPLEEPKNPDTCAVFQLYSLFATPEQRAQMRENYLGGGYGYGHAKVALFELIEAHFQEAHARREALLAEPERVEAVLQQGAERARVVARRVLQRARVACGLG